MASMDQDKWDRHEGRFTELEGEDGPYRYVEGAIANPDRLDKASRTVVTAEIGSSPSRMRHIIEQDGVRRRLMPIELERLNQFPDNWTRIDGIADSKRGFLMGNALVVGVIDRLREPLLDRISSRTE
jgi:DNA (cytosine-5)-methyltransferase 1